MLPEKFQEPAGFQWGSFTNAKGAKIRYGSVQPEGEVKGTMVVVPGFGEPLEKYFEVIREMQSKGFAVWMMEWHGQGGSDHFIKDNPQKMHSEGYAEHVETLHQFTQTIVTKTEGPLMLTAHSMGAHIGLRYLKEHEGVFDSAILTAPMFNISTNSLPRPVARQIAKFAKAGNYMDKYVPGGADRPEAGDPFANNPKTSDPVRFEVMQEIYRNKPELRTSSPTYGWVYHSFESIDILSNEAYLKEIKTPVLLEISGKELIVDKTAAEKAAPFLPNCTRVDIPDARHEIWMERDELRGPWLAKVASFIEGRLNKQAPLPKKFKQNSAHRPPKLG